MKEKISLSGKKVEGYDTMIPPPDTGEAFIQMNACYCNNCGKTFALYSFSAWKPNKRDENNVPYYECCGIDECKSPEN